MRWTCSVQPVPGGVATTGSGRPPEPASTCCAARRAVSRSTFLGNETTAGLTVAPVPAVPPLLLDLCGTVMGLLADTTTSRGAVALQYLKNSTTIRLLMRYHMSSVSELISNRVAASPVGRARTTGI